MMPMRLTLPTATPITAQHEIQLLTQASARQQLSDSNRLRLAESLSLLLRDDEALAVLAQDPGIDHQHQFALTRGRIHLDRLEGEDSNQAVASLRLAVDTAPDHAARSVAAADLGKAEAQRGDVDAAAESLLQSLSDNPGNAYAFSRLSRLELKLRDSASVIRRSNSALLMGNDNSAVISSLMLALTQSGDVATAEQLQGLDRLFTSALIEAPAGWPSLAAFNQALATELLAHPGARLSRSMRSIGGRYRVDNPLLPTSSVFPQLLEVLEQQVVEHAAAVSTPGHPWQLAQPDRADLFAWSVATHGDGHDPWHMHHRAWLSGVYYVGIPKGVENQAQGAGSIDLGLPDIEELVGTERSARIGIQPTPGTVLLFPSHVWHRTYPTGSSERRLSVAFDVVPNRTGSEDR